MSFRAKSKKSFLKSGIGANYLILVEKAGLLDKLTVQTEVTPELLQTMRGC